MPSAQGSAFGPLAITAEPGVAASTAPAGTQDIGMDSNKTAAEQLPDTLAGVRQGVDDNTEIA